MSATGIQDDKAGRIEQVRDGLLQMAIARGPGIKLPTVRELCAQFDVPFRTLEHAIIQLEQRQMLTRRQGSGIYATENVRQKTIGVVFGGDIFAPWYSPFWSMMLGAVRNRAGERNVQPRAYFDIDDGHAQLIEDLEARRLDGLLLLAPAHDRDEAGELARYGVPLVTFGGNKTADGRVDMDFGAFLERAAHELGRFRPRHIAVLSHGIEYSALAGELCRAGMPSVRIDDWSYGTWSCRIALAGTHENCARLVAERLIAGAPSEPLPEAVVSFEDTMTRGVIGALQAAGIRPGRDIQIVTIENKGSPLLEPWAAMLTRVQYDPADCMKAALERLEMLMNGKTPPQKEVRVAPSAVIRGSSLTARLEKDTPVTLSAAALAPMRRRGRKA